MQRITNLLESNLGVSWILQTLLAIPFCIHNEHLHPIIPHHYYSKAPLSNDNRYERNAGRPYRFEDVCGRDVNVTFYPDGRVDIVPVDSVKPHKLATIQDVKSIIQFTEGIRTRIIDLLDVPDDYHIPHSPSWPLSYFEICKDLELPPEFRRYYGLTIELGDLVDTFKFYIKEMGGNPYLRAEIGFPWDNIVDGLSELVAPHFAIIRRLNIIMAQQMTLQNKKFLKLSKRKKIDTSKIVQSVPSTQLPDNSRDSLVSRLPFLIPEGEPIVTCSDCGRLIYVGSTCGGAQSNLWSLFRDHLRVFHGDRPISEYEWTKLIEAGFRRHEYDSYY